MWSLSLAFVDIALHRRGPQHLPASEFLLGLVLAVYLAIGLVALQIGSTLLRALTVLLFDTALYLTAIWVVLRLFGKQRRYAQTATAMVGTDALLNAIVVPLALWNEALQAPPTETTPPQWLVLLLYIWSIDIGGYIFSKALDRPYIVGVSIVIVYVLTSMTLREAFFPTAS